MNPYESPCLNADHEPVKTRLQFNQVHLLFVGQAHKAHVLIQSVGHSTQGPGSDGQDVIVRQVTQVISKIQHEKKFSMITRN